MLSKRKRRPREADEHQTPLVPSRGTGVELVMSARNSGSAAMGSRDMTEKSKDFAHKATARAGVLARNWEIYVPPAKSAMSVKVERVEARVGFR